MTSDKPPKHNLQIQANNGSKEKAVKKVAPQTVAGPVLATGTETAAEIRSAFLAKILF
jgi:hypothetical protein